MAAAADRDFDLGLRQIEDDAFVADHSHDVGPGVEAVAARATREPIVGAPSEAFYFFLILRVFSYLAGFILRALCAAP